MIETPAAALIADVLVKEADFFNRYKMTLHNIYWQ